MAYLNLQWIKSTKGDWCGLLNLNLNHEHFDDNLSGVYIIWSGRFVIRMGSGVIKDRLTEHRQNEEIIKYPNLKVTWAQVHQNQMAGVEKYLSEIYTPVIGERFPDSVQKITVNSPWG